MPTHLHGDARRATGLGPDAGAKDVGASAVARASSCNWPQLSGVRRLRVRAWARQPRDRRGRNRFALVHLAPRTSAPRRAQSTVSERSALLPKSVRARRPSRWLSVTASERSLSARGVDTLLDGAHCWPVGSVSLRSTAELSSSAGTASRHRSRLFGQSHAAGL